MMVDRHFIITPSPPRQQFILWQDARLAKFCQAWQRHSSLNTLIDPQNVNRADIWEAVCYIEYEDLYSMFCTDAADFCQLASIAFGQVLTDYFGMRWCHHSIFSHDFLLCFDEMPNHIIDVYALVFERWQSAGSYELPLLWTDMTLKFMYTSVFNEFYPLAPMLGVSWQDAQPIYQEHFACDFDEVYHQRLNRLWQVDDERLIRCLEELPFLPPDGQLKWLKRRIETTEQDLSKHFDNNWQILKAN